jgi:uncharacterized membrane protein
MKTLVKVFATGFFAVLPVILVYLLVGQLLDMMMVLTVPILDFLPEGGAFDLDAQVLAVVLLLALLFLIGLAALTGPGQRLGDWVERTALSKVPLYDMFRNLASRLGGDEKLSHFKPALVRTWGNMQTFAFVVEEHANGDYTIFIPIAPTPSVGYVSIIGPDDVRLLDVPASKALSAVLSWGHGAAEAVQASTTTPPTADPGASK